MNDRQTNRQAGQRGRTFRPVPAAKLALIFVAILATVLVIIAAAGEATRPEPADAPAHGEGATGTGASSTPTVTFGSIPIAEGSVDAQLTLTPLASPAESVVPTAIARYEIDGLGYAATFVQELPAPCDTIADAGNPFLEGQYPVWYGMVGGQYLQVCGGNDRQPGGFGIIAIRTWATSPWRDGKLAEDVAYDDGYYKTRLTYENLRLVAIEQNSLLRVAEGGASYLYFDLAKRQWKPYNYGTPVSSQGVTVLLPGWTLNVTREQLNRQLARWHSHAIEDYELALQIRGTGYSPDEQGDYYVEVRGGVARITIYHSRFWPEKVNPEFAHVPRPTPAPTPDRSNFVQQNTVEAQFARLNTMLDASTPVYCRVSFEPTYGFPDSLTCKDRPDEAVYYDTVRLTLIKVLKKGER